jgi:cytochrome b
MYRIDTIALPHEGPAPAALTRWARHFVLACHWTLAASFVIAWFSDCLGALHQGAGVLALALVALRVLWGLAVGAQGQREAGRSGTGMVLILLGAVAAAGLTGWMLTLDGFRSTTPVALAHLWAVDLTLVAMGVHVLDTLFGSLAFSAEAP